MSMWFSVAFGNRLMNVRRYLGAANEIEGGNYRTILMSILGVEARHTAYLRASLGRSPFLSPFDTPLNFVRSLFVYLGKIESR